MVRTEWHGAGGSVLVRATARLARLRADLRVDAPASVAQRIAVDNVRRIRTFCALAVVISGGSIALFVVLEPVDAVEAAWRWQVLVGHAALLTVVAVLLAVTTRPRWRQADVPGVSVRAIRAVEWAAIVALLGIGTYLTAVDQAVTDAVTPFVLVCVLAGMLVLVPASRSVPAFAIAALLFVMVVGGDIVGGGSVASEAVVASNQVNGLAAAVLGLLLSIVRYNGEVRSLVQQHEIEAQRAALQRANTVLTHTAAHDELTGLVNRREANRRIGDELQRLRRGGGSAYLLLLDLDRFKLINDRLGHPAGDRLLQLVSEVLRSRLRRADLAARWGGEEFLVLLVDTDRAGAIAVAEDLREAIGSRRFDLDAAGGAGGAGGAGEADVTVSIGVAPLDATVATPIDLAYRAVDDALYAAKAAGRDRVVAATAAALPASALPTTVPTMDHRR